MVTWLTISRSFANSSPTSPSPGDLRDERRLQVNCVQAIAHIVRHLPDKIHEPGQRDAGRVLEGRRRVAHGPLSKSEPLMAGLGGIQSLNI